MERFYQGYVKTKSCILFFFRSLKVTLFTTWEMQIVPKRRSHDINSTCSLVEWIRKYVVAIVPAYWWNDANHVPKRKPVGYIEYAGFQRIQIRSWHSPPAIWHSPPAIWHSPPAIGDGYGGLASPTVVNVNLYTCPFINHSPVEPL